MFDDFIREKANEHEAPVPPDAWDNIVKKKKKRRFAFWWWTGAVTLLLGVSIAAYFLLQPQDGNSNHELASSDQKAADLKRSNESVSKSPAAETEKNIQPPVAPDIDVNSKRTELSTDVNTKENTINKTKTTIVNRSKTTIAIRNGDPGDENNDRSSRKKDPANVKGRLMVQQTVPGTGDIPEEDEKTNTSMLPEKEDKKKITTAENEQAVALDVPDKKAADAKEEKTKQELLKKATEKENAKKERSKKRWFIEASAMPLVTSSKTDESIAFNRTLSIGNSNTVYNGNLLKTSIEPAIAFSFAVRKELNKKFSMGIGLQYLQLKENLQIEGKEITTIYTPVQRLLNGQLVPDTVVTVSEGIRTITAVNSYRQFSIPVFMQYSIIQKKQWSLCAVGGMYININSSFQTEIDRNADAPLLAIPAPENKTNTGLDVLAGVRISKTLGKRADFFVLPSMRWNLTRYTVENSLLNRKMNQAGVGFGVCYKIK